MVHGLSVQKPSLQYTLWFDLLQRKLLLVPRCPVDSFSRQAFRETPVSTPAKFVIQLPWEDGGTSRYDEDTNGQMPLHGRLRLRLRSRMPSGEVGPQVGPCYSRFPEETSNRDEWFSKQG